MSSNYQAVLAAVREWVKYQDQQFGIWDVRRALEQEIAGSTNSHRRLTDTYCAHVLRAVNLLVSEGALVKHGEGRDAYYRTPAAETAAQFREQRAAGQRAAELETWRQRKTRLAGHRLLDISSSVTDIRLSPESWDGLLACLDELAGRRKAGS
jgi:hypothetical protein